jgi:site-specific DNA recombinase
MQTLQQILQSGPVLIYARYSSMLQNERSIEDQVRRCREFIVQHGGKPEDAQVFADFAVSGASLDRPGFESMMAAVNGGRGRAIVTEDMSRISRDFADSAQIFKQLQFRQVPLLGVADGIDTSSKHAKLSFTVKSLVADIYLDDLRDKTLRGLEGRALAGFATGNVAYGYHTVPVEEGGHAIGNKIEIHPRESIIIRRIFEECRAGRSYAAIASGLNRERIPSPRVGSRHKCFGWGSSTIRAMLYNERYAGVWRFKERQWVKVPGTNRRQPQARSAGDVMTMERPELRIVDAETWTEVKARLAAVNRNYTKRKREGGIVRKPTAYLLSGLLCCAQCGAPMSISAGSNAAYYRCQGNRTKGTCPNRVSVREDVARRCVLRTIQEHMLSPDGIAQFRKRIAEELRDYSRNLEARRKERVERLARTEDKIRGLIEFIATGDRSEYVVSTLRDLEAFARSEKTALAELAQEANRPIRLPSIDEVTALAIDLDARLTDDPEVGRAALRRWLHEGVIRVDQSPEGPVAETELLPLMVLIDGAEKAEGKGGRPRKLEIPGESSISRDIKLLSISSGGRI